jgi:hypothetical protein
MYLIVYEEDKSKLLCNIFSSGKLGLSGGHLCLFGIFWPEKTKETLARGILLMRLLLTVAGYLPELLSGTNGPSEHWLQQNFITPKP